MATVVQLIIMILASNGDSGHHNCSGLWPEDIGALIVELCIAADEHIAKIS